MELGQEGKMEVQLKDGQALTGEDGSGSGPNQMGLGLELDEGKTHEASCELTRGLEENAANESNTFASPSSTSESSTAKKVWKEEGQQYCRRHFEGRKILSEEGAPCTGSGVLPYSEDDEMTGESASKTLPRRCKTRNLTELGVFNSQPRRSVRLSSRLSQAGNTSSHIQGMSSTTISDGDIANCNVRWRDSELLVEPSKLWGISRQAGITCRRDELEVVKEYICLEERDLEIMKNVEESKKDGLL